MPFLFRHLYLIPIIHSVTFQKFVQGIGNHPAFDKITRGMLVPTFQFNLQKRIIPHIKKELYIYYRSFAQLYVRFYYEPRIK